MGNNIIKNEFKGIRNQLKKVAWLAYMHRVINSKHICHLKYNVYSVLRSIYGAGITSRPYQCMTEVASLQLLGLASISFAMGARINVRPTKLGWIYIRHIAKNPKYRSKVSLISLILKSHMYLRYKNTPEFVQEAIDDQMYVDPVQIRAQIKVQEHLVQKLLYGQVIF